MGNHRKHKIGSRRHKRRTSVNTLDFRHSQQLKKSYLLPLKLPFESSLSSGDTPYNSLRLLYLRLNREENPKCNLKFILDTNLHTITIVNSKENAKYKFILNNYPLICELGKFLHSLPLSSRASNKKMVNYFQEETSILDCMKQLKKQCMVTEIPKSTAQPTCVIQHDLYSINHKMPVDELSEVLTESEDELELGIGFSLKNFSYSSSRSQIPDIVENSNVSDFAKKLLLNFEKMHLQAITVSNNEVFKPELRPTGSPVQALLEICGPKSHIANLLQQKGEADSNSLGDSSDKLEKCERDEKGDCVKDDYIEQKQLSEFCNKNPGVNPFIVFKKNLNVNFKSNNNMIDALYNLHNNVVHIENKLLNFHQDICTIKQTVASLIFQCNSVQSQNVDVIHKFQHNSNKTEESPSKGNLLNDYSNSKETFKNFERSLGEKKVKKKENYKKKVMKYVLSGVLLIGFFCCDIVK